MYETKHPVSIIEKYIIDSEEKDKFGLWAFGENYKNLNYMTSEPVNAWNDLHSSELKLMSSGKPSEDIPKMIDLWRKLNSPAKIP